ncbi:MAG: CPBP family glutamic-type intramembrane protease [Planctomycetota bacterium]
MAVEPTEPPADAPRSTGIALAATVFYSLLAAGGWFWLSSRGRLAELPAATGGSVGLPISMAIGIAVGLGLSACFALLVRYLGVFRRLVHGLAELLGPTSQTDLFVLSSIAPVAEEFFFRLAVQDAWGLVPAALLYAALHISPRAAWLCCGVGLILGLLFGWLVAMGCGLLAATAAHALFNYLTLLQTERL